MAQCQLKQVAGEVFRSEHDFNKFAQTSESHCCSHSEAESGHAVLREPVSRLETREWNVEMELRERSTEKWNSFFEKMTIFKEVSFTYWVPTNMEEREGELAKENQRMEESQQENQ